MTDCANIAKKYLKTLDKNIRKSKVRELKQSDLTSIEYWILYYTYGEKNFVINTCMKLGLSEAQFHIHLLVALTKVYYILDLKTLEV